MKIHKFLILVCLLIFVSCAKKNLQLGDVSLIPMPVEVAPSEGYFEINKNTIVSVENETQAMIANRFFKQFEVVSGWIPSVKTGTEKGDIILINDSSFHEEAYELNVTKSTIEIKAATGAGFFYALQSLKQLLPTSFYAKKQLVNVSWGVPVVRIKDAPNFKWRGYMLDVSRHFFDKEQVKDALDFMAEIKLNRFHWHLSDDQGWRIEIKKYPKLTEVGAWRVDYNITDESLSNWWGRPIQKEGEKATYGGFYTQDDIKEIVAYAKERFIEIIPEIDMPGHSLAAIASYPEIACADGPFYVGTGGVIKNNTYCPGKEVTFEFVEDVLEEIIDLFPFEYIHIGGDECNKEAWKIDPDCQQRIKEENLANEHELQSYFIKRVEKMVNSRGKNMIGWDEIIEGGLAPNATVMSWRGEKGGITAARAGHDVIMTPFKYCYLDLKQGDDDLEPNLGYGYSFLKDSYHYKIISDSLTEEQGKHVMGIQGNLWTESISDFGKLTYMTFPRLYAIAENGWITEKSKDWEGFTKRLLTQFERLDARGTRYATSAFNARIDHKGNKNGGIDITLKSEVGNLDIYYTLDGSTPSLSSNKYENEFSIDKTATLKASTFLNEKQIGNISQKFFPVHKGFGASLVFNSPKISDTTNALIDLNYGKLNRWDAPWKTFNDNLDVELNFPEITEINKVELDFLRFTIAGIYVPEYVEISASEDGKSFKKIAEINQMEASHTQGRNKVKTTFDFPKTKVKALKIKARRVNPIPEGHHKVGTASKILLDELVIF
ncbi:beta-N-acetylhexosaminidase [Flavivirga jejuensis]|uniref:beta-N-acetylhexosaminidase n=1 Tax=Flavivirga jejuensis TaxID=870487 RepID=A0ABT8WMZ7_9FLAO|nr:family 20 glycosylhydrolase [Flavivirga jejuensis]MDO5974533.1 family 20 glycosylhydrolase [Flavivirga jejuensis]